VFLKLGVATHLCVANILQCVAKKNLKNNKDFKQAQWGI
jgi:hypothetical protein